MKILGIAALLIVALACASLDEVENNWRNTGYQLRRADPGKVDLVCYDKGHLDNGFLKSWNDSYCGCVDPANKIVWISRKISCPRLQVEDHEGCHIALGHSPEARKICAEEFRL